MGLQLNHRRGPADNFENCRLNEQPYKYGNDYRQVTLSNYGEYASTVLIAEAGSNSHPDSTENGMALLLPDTKTWLDTIFKKGADQKEASIFKRKWDIDYKAGKPTIVVMDRDTGRSADSVYTELDTGTGTDMVRTIVADISYQEEQKLRVTLCGLESESKGDGIGRYWKDLPSVKDIQGYVLDNTLTKRDDEAYFFQWAAKKNFFKMTIGLRCGVMDLYTFLGVPTVSIGLRNMIGEDGHELLAGPHFNRASIQYGVPRHWTTAYIRNNEKPDADQNSEKSDPLLNSPYWKGDTPGGKEGDPSWHKFLQKRSPPKKEIYSKNKTNEKSTRTREPRKKKEKLDLFSEPDRHVLTVGVRTACKLNMG